MGVISEDLRGKESGNKTMKTLTLSNLEQLPFDVEEALNRLRINIGFCGEKYKKIVITSSTPDEGKSFISANLWRLLSEAGKRVVLVDADIRKSVLRGRYQISSEDGNFLGIAHYLSGQAELKDVTYETNIKNAFLVPSAYTVTNPAILLQSVRFDSMLDALTKAFDYVLIDTPPLTNVADGGLIASKCDGVVLVVRSGKTPRSLISSSIKQIDQSGCDLMGVVLSRVEMKKNVYYSQYSKYGYYSNGYGYGEDSKTTSRTVQ